MSTETPASNDIISDLHNDLESATRENCTCGSNPERSCKHCDRWTRAMDKACSAIGEIEIENNQLRARVAELENKNKTLANAIVDCLSYSNGRETEWGDRALGAFSFLNSPEVRQAIDDARKGQQ